MPISEVKRQPGPSFSLRLGQRSITIENCSQCHALVLEGRYGVSRRLYESFLRPLLLVGLFAPPEDLSAAAMVGTFYFYSELRRSYVHMHSFLC